RGRRTQRGGQVVLGLRLGLRRGGRGRGGGRRGQVVEHLPLVRGVALDGLDQVRDQVVPPLELDVDVGEAFVGAGLQPDQAVERRDRVDHGDQDQGEDDQQDYGHEDLSVRRWRTCVKVSYARAPE